MEKVIYKKKKITKKCNYKLITNMFINTNFYQVLLINFPKLRAKSWIS